MRVAESNALIASPRGTINAIVPPVNVRSAGVGEVAAPEPEPRTTPFERIEASSPEPREVAGEAAIEKAAPLSDAPSTRSISAAVRGLSHIGRYELTGKIGHGSFGVVYTAHDTELEREVALKILNPSHHGDADALHRFLREARAAARIAHPGIVTVHDCGRYSPSGGELEGDELAYIAMELLGGESLTERLDRVGRLRPRDAAEVVRQVASALDAAHRADVLHRDLKPDNVFLVPDPAVPCGERAKVLDFGLAKIGSSRHTRMGSVFGTPLYMSPEQCRSSGGIDARSDIYALGCILFELLAGRTPFEGAIYEVVERQQHEAAPRVAELAPGIPPALDALVAEMLEKDPDDRPPTMADVVLRLEDVLASPEARVEVQPARAMSPAPAREAPLELDEADRIALDALAPRPPRFATYVDPGRRTPRSLALVAAIAIAIAIAGALSLLAANRGIGSGGGDRHAPSPAARVR